MSDFFGNLESIIVLFGIFICPFLVVPLTVYFFFRARQAKRKLQAEVYLKALEQGKELPADLFAQPAKSNTLNKGIILVMVGVGIGAFFVFDGNVGTGLKLGAIPFCIGLAYLIIHFIGKKQSGGDTR